ncbi:hypothetical protein BDN72DRAFT_830041 [Pluteus cervinus]|uniref:Uncharacterized protein n=1 Tax=Pluteus cervinus TaxID=181527 RepID=A0ACD3BFH9_9AGAR|nr:hypothetical protein BDN72DRAFT_830041 [Pluteus cervinus]
MFWLRRKEIPWELVERRTVDAVPTYYDDEVFDVAAVGKADAHGTYIYDLQELRKSTNISTNIADAVVFSRKQLLQRAEENGFNALLLESWEVTIYRKGKRYRLEVKYSGRPARINGKVAKHRPPPFMALLRTHD